MTAPGQGPLWVVVPACDEEAGIGATLAAPACQSDTRFAPGVVDNASTDATAAGVRRFAAGAPFPVHLVHEDRPGTAAAADTGFRYGIGPGAALLVPTDADCVPAADRIAAARAEFGRGTEPACGRSVPRRDERPALAERYALPAAIRAAALYGRYRGEHRHLRCRAPHVLCHGHNPAVTAAFHLRCGGTPSEPLEGPPEDVAFRAREHSGRIARAERMVVHTSLRRLRARGARRTLPWCWDRRYRPADLNEVHVR
ncbi:glycosyltransferase family A protein [Streptomyces sp. NPDC052301]|uniref:glycosyltransferase family A protein n=1 Tax=Streptomyces sp. NPDC052301 TaxID=3365687 RepID=UPI0037CEB6DD